MGGLDSSIMRNAAMEKAKKLGFRGIGEEERKNGSQTNTQTIHRPIWAYNRR